MASHQTIKASRFSEQASNARYEAERIASMADEYAKILPVLKDFFEKTRCQHIPYADGRRAFANLIRQAALEASALRRSLR